MTMRPLREHQSEGMIRLRQSLAGGRLEGWRPVVGYEGLYEVSCFGRVRSLDRVITARNKAGNFTDRLHKGRVLALTVDVGLEAYGRLQVKLCAFGEQKTRLVHQLVAEAFIGPRLPGLEVAHDDGDASNNRAENLRYATAAENSADKVRHGTHNRGTRAGACKLTEDDVRDIRQLRGMKTCEAIASQFQISLSQVSRIQNRRQWEHLA